MTLQERERFKAEHPSQIIGTVIGYLVAIIFLWIVATVRKL